MPNNQIIAQNPNKLLVTQGNRVAEIFDLSFNGKRISEELQNVLTIFKPEDVTDILYNINDSLLDCPTTHGDVKKQLRFLRELTFLFERLS